MQSAVKQLKEAKRFNKMAATLIVIMLIIMGSMVRDMRYWADQYEELAGRYEV